MVKNLSLGDLELILCDWYEMDEQLPNPIFEKKEFERVSNGLWAIGEFRNYVSKQIYPETQTCFGIPAGIKLPISSMTTSIFQTKSVL